jgi:hypothetical protein
VEKLVAKHGDGGRPLEEYLRALWRLAAAHAGEESLPVDRFTSLFTVAFTAEAPPSL